MKRSVSGHQPAYSVPCTKYRLPRTPYRVPVAACTPDSQYGILLFFVNNDSNNNNTFIIITVVVLITIIELRSHNVHVPFPTSYLLSRISPAGWGTNASMGPGGGGGQGQSGTASYCAQNCTARGQVSLSLTFAMPLACMPAFSAIASPALDT